MDEMTVKRFVAQKLHEGIKLTDIQNMLVDELEYKMTFLELRLLAAELEDVDWAQFDPKEKKPEGEAAVATAEAADNAPTADNAAEDNTDGAEAAPAGGKTVVELSRLARPGAIAHGTVTFASGVTAEWLVDEMGRLGLDKVSGQPNENDIAEFQTELRKLFERR